MNPARLHLAVAGLLLALALAFVAPALRPGQVWAPADIPLTEAPFTGGPAGRADAANGLLADLIYQELPWRLLAQREFAAGRFPLWNDTALHGYPLFGNGQSAILYPLNLLWILLPVARAAALIAALKLWLAGLGMWVFLRSLAIRTAPAILAALGWMFSAPMVVWLGWPHTNVLLLLPWLAWAVGGWGRDRRYPALLAVAGLVAVAVFGGHAETLQNVALVSALWAGALLLGQPWRRAVARALALLAAAVLGLALAAVQLLPFLQTLLLSREWATRELAGPPFAAYFPAEYLWTWLVPNWFGYPPGHTGWGIFNYNEQTGYVGLAPLGGALLAGVAAARRRIPARPVLAWAGVLLLALGLAYDPFAGGVLRALPPLNHSINLRWIAPAAFALLVLAAHGWQTLGRATDDARRTAFSLRHSSLVTPRFAAGALIVLGGIVVALHLAGVPGVPPMVRPLAAAREQYRVYWALWAAGLGAATLGLLMLWAQVHHGATESRRLEKEERDPDNTIPASGPPSTQPGTPSLLQTLKTSPRLRASAVPIALGAVLLLDLWRIGFGYTPVRPAAELYPPDPLLDRLAALPATARVLIGGTAPRPGLNIAYGFRDWRAQDPAAPQRADVVAGLLSPTMLANYPLHYNMLLPDPRLDLAALLGLDYALLPAGIDPNAGVPPVGGAPVFTRLDAEGGLVLWQNTAATPFAYLAGRGLAAEDEPAARAWLAATSWPRVLARDAILETPAEGFDPRPQASDQLSAQNTQSAIRNLDYVPGAIDLQVTAPAPAWLIVNESWAPGWRASVDGQPVALWRANYLVQGIAVPAGTHAVALRYDPGSVRWGLVVSLTAATVAVALVAGTLFARRRPRQRAAS